MNGFHPQARLARGDALIIVDVQNDFLPGGALAVPRGDAILPVMNAYIERFRHAGLPVFATRDWHPPHHCSFRPQGGPWPVHCVAGTSGAEFPPALALPPDTVILSKAQDADRDAYSGFNGTHLAERLRARGIRRLFIGGLATDYCVLNTVLDALREGFRVFLLEDAIRAVNAQPDDGAQAVARMRRAGAEPLRLEDLVT
jgi:nicotinamidase/pyrazinamidase